jgi:hypothetical protein
MSDGTDRTPKNVDTALSIWDRKRLAEQQPAEQQQKPAS